VTVTDIDEQSLLTFPSKGAALGGRMSWVRTVLTDALPDVDRVVYLDADTLVRHSVLPLWTALDGAPIAAVTNTTEPAMYEYVQSLGLSDPAEYFNAGVLVMDLAQWREEGVIERITALSRERPLRWYDQDALNVVFAGRWRRLHPRWNAMNSLWFWTEHARRIFTDDELDTARANPAIAHFEGPHVVKPWHYLSRHPFREEYRAALAKTAWTGRSLDERTLATRAIARLPDNRQLMAYARWKDVSAKGASVRRRAINLGARARAKARNPKVSTVVSPLENMLFEGTLRLYFETGEDAMEQIRAGLAAAGVSEPPTRVLDLPSGYGRVLRYMRASWPEAELVAMELREGAPEFCAAAFGARPVQSVNPLWTVDGVGEDFDLVWSGSLLTHMDSADWVPTLRYFRDRLRPGGAMIFTTHGERSIQLLARDPGTIEIVRSACEGWTGDYGLDDADAAAMVKRARDTGFAFTDYGWDVGAAWGLSVSTPEWVRRIVASVDDLELVAFVPHGWSEHQDVWAYTRKVR